MNTLNRKQFLISAATLATQPLLARAAAVLGETRFFKHGVASGDPLQDRVIIWTRITTGGRTDRRVRWELASDEHFRQIVQGGDYTISPEHDYTVKVDVNGLQPGTRYFYRFRYRNETSVTGATRTLPTALNGQPFYLAVASCSHWEAGFFNAYRFLAQKDEVDLVLHLGDYIYEGGPGKRRNSSLGRIHSPGHEILTLQDYRERYAQYRTDPDLQLLHAAKPFCLVWDDHESANNSYVTGAQNHQPGEEGPWEVRKQAAVQAYFEWLPVRGSGAEDLQRKLSIGQDFELFLLDQRLTGRSQQRSLKDPDFYDESRTLLGQEQYRWLESNLRSSQARWKLIGNQVPITGYKPGAGKLPGYSDKWLGYPHEYNKMLDLLEQEKIENTVFLTGDTHRAVVLALHREQEYMTYTRPCTDKPLAWELYTPSITSGNDDDMLLPELKAKEKAVFDKTINPHLLFADMTAHGYYIARIDAQSFKADYYFTDSLITRRTGEQKAASLAMNAGDFLLEAT